MGHMNREIEVKLVVHEIGLPTAVAFLEKFLDWSSPEIRIGSSTDTYWPLRNPEVVGDFIRLRERDGIRQVTVKGKDKGTNFDRLEIDVDSTSSVEDLYALLTAAHGPALGVVEKIYHVFFLNAITNICCYQVTSHDYPHVIMEVEAASVESVEELTASLMEALEEAGYSVAYAPGSLYEMFVTGEAMS